jgi:hypothetical protein
MQLSDSFSHSAITWSLVDGPQGLAVNPTTGAITWAPPAGTLLGPYSITVQATNYAGSVSLTVPLMLTFSTGPSQFAASNLNSTAGSADVTWSAPTASASAITGYRISVTYIDASGVTHTQVFIAPSASRKLTLTGLPKGTTFNVSIAALDLVGDVGTPSLLKFSL